MISLDLREYLILPLEDLSFDEIPPEAYKLRENRPKLISHLNSSATKKSSRNCIISNITSSPIHLHARSHYVNAVRMPDDDMPTDGNDEMPDIHANIEISKINIAVSECDAANRFDQWRPVQENRFFSTQNVKIGGIGKKVTKDKKVTLKDLLAGCSAGRGGSTNTEVKNISPRGGSKFANYWEQPRPRSQI